MIRFLAEWDGVGRQEIFSSCGTSNQGSREDSDPQELASIPFAELGSRAAGAGGPSASTAQPHRARRMTIRRFGLHSGKMVRSDIAVGC